MVHSINSTPFLTPINFLSTINAESFVIYPPEIKPSEVKSQNAIQHASQTQQAPTLDPKMVNLWKKFGWTSAQTNPKNKSTKLRDLSSLLVFYPDLVQFLRKSGLLYTIRGFQNTLDQANGTIPPNASKIQTGIRLDYDGHPLLLKEGNWVRWEVIKKIICYDFYISPLFIWYFKNSFI